VLRHTVNREWSFGRNRSDDFNAEPAELAEYIFCDSASSDRIRWSVQRDRLEDRAALEDPLILRVLVEDGRFAKARNDERAITAWLGRVRSSIKT
jgi:hypothetical protein